MTRTMLHRPTNLTTASAGTMHAIVQDDYGCAPETVLRLAEIDRPTIEAHEVLVRVRAASVDRGTWHLMTGVPKLMRVRGFGLGRPSAPNPGRCLAGTVEAVGRDVTEFELGDEVFGTCDGSFSEYAGAPTHLLARKPANISFEQAAAIPVSGVTALQAVRDRAQVQAGERVLVLGAAGGVGIFALQIAKAFGAEVTGVCSTAKTDLVRALGADHVVDYTHDDFAREEVRYDAIIDTGGNSGLLRLRRALTPGGRLVIVGGETDGPWLGGFDRQLRAAAFSPLVSQKLRILTAKENSADLSVLRELLESRKITPVIDQTYPLCEAAAAIRRFQEGHARGKIIVTM